MKTEVGKYQGELKAVGADYLKRERELQLRLADLESRRGMFNANLRYSNTLWTMAKVLGGAAIVWTSIGFFLWHRRVQVYQDRILRKEAEERAPTANKQKPAD